MSEPKRWLDDDAALSADERRVLEAGLSVRPPRGAKTAVLAAVLTGLPSGAAAAAGGSASAGAGAAVLGFLKPAAVGFALGVATTATVAVLGPLVQSNDRAPAAAPVIDPKKPAESLPRSNPPPGPPPNEAVADEPAPPTPSPQPVRADPPHERATGVAPEVGSVRAFPEVLPDDAGAGAQHESKRVAEARALLRAGNARAAFDALERVRTDFPRGILVQEREALAIEALLVLGERAAARARAREFLERFPASPHAAAARRALD